MAEIRDLRPLNRQTPQGEARTAIAQNAKITPFSGIERTSLSKEPSAVISLDERRKQYREGQAGQRRVADAKDVNAEVIRIGAEVRDQSAKTTEIIRATTAATQAFRERSQSEPMPMQEHVSVQSSSSLEPSFVHETGSEIPEPAIPEPVKLSFGTRIKNGLVSLRNTFFPRKAA